MVVGPDGGDAVVTTGSSVVACRSGRLRGGGLVASSPQDQRLGSEHQQDQRADDALLLLDAGLYS
jgi:hypothetical protein